LRILCGPGPGPRLTVEVVDTGIGLTEADMSHVFGEFVQAHAGLTRRYGGTGLGLAIVRRLVRLMGGEVTLSGAPGRGLVARVELALPVLPDSSVPETSASLPCLPPLHVLAAEDNATNRIILSSMLAALGVTSEIVDSGDALLARWPDRSFDVVLLDIAMPGRDGVETLAALRALAAATGRPMPPALAVTANAMTHQLASYLNQGFAAVVPKPLRAEDLARALLACQAPAEGAP
jgi:CheY-like chemotaxis protein